MLLNMTTLKISKIIKNDSAVSSDDGETVYQLILDSIRLKEITELDFAGISIITTAFLNSAIGQLYDVFSSEELNKYIVLKNVPKEDAIQFKKVIERAKEYFQNRKGLEGNANYNIYGR
jgi:hypothetical protein